MKFKDRLKELRYENSLSQKEIADGCKLSTQCISQLELGTRNPTGSTLEALADFFEVTTDFLLGREDDFGNVALYRTDCNNTLTTNEQKIIDTIRENTLFNALEWVSLYARLPGYMQESIFAELKGMYLGYTTAKSKKRGNI